jgi:hypothetical protein
MLPKWMTDHVYLVSFLFIIITGLAIYIQAVFEIKESFQTVSIERDPSTNLIKRGYYKTSSNTMAVIPYGYVIDPADETKVIPKSQSATQSTMSEGDKWASTDILPDDYYIRSADGTMGVLPSGMMPDVSSIDVNTSTVPPKLVIEYKPGYVNKDTYYNTVFTPLRPIGLPLPKGIYYFDSGKTQVAFLPYGKIPNTTLGYGYVKDPNLISPTGEFEADTRQYGDISNNYDITFHADAKTIMEMDETTDLSFGQVRVIDQCGNVVILPSAPVQSPLTYYQPGSFPFGASTYIPKYEDSVYLSRLTQLATTAPYVSSNVPKGACDLNKDFPNKQEEYCRTLDKGTCASTSCCVLMGGEKCVAGNETGPLYKANYGDFLMRNKDKYFFNGKCYGNC